LTFKHSFWYIEKMKAQAQADGDDPIEAAADVNSVEAGPDVEEASSNGTGGLIGPQATLAEALDRLRDSDMAAAPIIDDATGQVVGFLSRAPVAVQVLPGPALEAGPPPRIGGMATPLGVYLTDGVSSGGADFWGLFLTGLVLCGLGIAAQVITSAALRYGAHTTAFVLQASLDEGHPQSVWRAWAAQSISLLPLPVVFLMIRLIPLSGTHAAEHQVVHCVERGAPLRCEIVRTMPRVHPRCGTNLFTGFMLFLIAFLGTFLALRDQEMSAGDSASVAVMVAAFFAAILWRRVGGWIQQWLVTRPATDLQIAGAIKAAEELLARRRTRGADASERLVLIRRIWYMGLIQVSIGYLALLSPLGLAASNWPWLNQFLQF
jgi:hypothetical protein